MRHLSSVVVTLAMTCVAAGCGQSSRSDTAAAGGNEAYPAVYRDLALPEIEGGTVTDTGRQTTSLRDGIVVSLDSPKTVDEARAFYRDSLAAAGWAIAPAGRGGALPNMSMGLVEATKDGRRYQATIMARPEGGTQIRVSVRQD